MLIKKLVCTHYILKLVFLKTSVPGAYSLLLWVSSTEVCFLSSCPLSHSAFPPQVTPYPLIHLSLDFGPVPRLTDPPGHTGTSPCPGCQCSMPLPSSCPSSILADAVFRASPEGRWPSREILGGGCQGLGGMKGKKTSENKMPGNSQC